MLDKWSSKWFRSGDRNSDFFRDLILMEVSEWNGIVRLIVSLMPMLDQFVGSFARAYVLSIFEFDEVRSIDFSTTRILINRHPFQWIKDICFL